MSEEKRHPIQVVARRTGLSPEVLRIWEKRYGIVTPARTQTGRRVYSDADIERLRLVRRATLAGRRVGEVCRLSNDGLEALFREDEQAALSALPASSRGRPAGAAAIAGEWEGAALFTRQSLDAMRALDGPRLEAILARALLTLGPTSFIDDLAAPLLRSVGEQWAQGRLDPYYEHLVTAVIRQTVTRLFVWQSPDEHAPVMVVATPAGQRHEIGAILAACAALAEGWRIVYLGADLPARDIARAAEQAQAGVVALSIIHPHDDPRLDGELTELSARLPKDVKVIAGGGAAASYARTLRKIGAETAPDIKGFRALLGGMRRGAAERE